jgi:hypothetical protein
MEQQKAMGTKQKTKPNKTGSAQKDTLGQAIDESIREDCKTT